MRTEYRSDLVYRPMVEENKECKHTMDLGENFVIMSIEKYDAMKDEFNICIEERDREMFKLDKELREVTEERDQYLDILKNMGLSEERSKLIVPDTGKFIEEEISPITMNRKIYCCFEIDGSWRE